MPAPDRSPQHAFHTTTVRHGRLVRLEPGEDAVHQTLTFPYNPETVTRSRAGRWEPRRRGRPTASVETAQQARGQLGGHGASALLAESETISFRIVLDATETILRAVPPAPATGAAAAAGAGGADTAASPEAWTVGVLPELAFLELVSLGRDPAEEPGAPRRGRRPASRSGRREEGTPIRPIRPDELLLQLGLARWFPCVLTELTITEQRFTPELVPVRAEVDLKLTVLEPVENTYNPYVRQTFDHLMAQRTRRAEGLGTTDRAALDQHLGGGRQP